MLRARPCTSRYAEAADFAPTAVSLRVTTQLVPVPEWYIRKTRPLRCPSPPVSVAESTTW